MRSIDFLSDSPKSFIFSKNSNKTFFGGILSLIFLIIVLLISLLYLVDYFINDKYTVEYGFYQEVLDDDKVKEKENSPKYNPELESGFLIKHENGTVINDDKILLLDNNDQPSPRAFRQNISNLFFSLFYKCENKNCTFNLTTIKLDLIFTGYKLDHQGETPLHIDEDLFYTTSIDFYFRSPHLKSFYWKNIKYNESLGFTDLFYKIFGIEKENEYIGAIIDTTETLSIKDIYGDTILDLIEINNTFYRLLGGCRMIMNFNKYDQYKRTKISIFDVIANICSLSMTIFGGFIYGFTNYYSKSYDNYEIIKKILSKKRMENINKSDNINKDLDKKNIINKDPSISGAILRDSNTNDLGIETVDQKEEKLIIEDKENRTLPNIKFISFILNNLPFKNCCVKSKSQKIISLCHELISEYYTVEYLVYNQIMVENLLKDYKWNDPSLNKIESNKFITQIKNNIY